MKFHPRELPVAAQKNHETRRSGTEFRGEWATIPNSCGISSSKTRKRVAPAVRKLIETANAVRCETMTKTDVIQEMESVLIASLPPPPPLSDDYLEYKCKIQIKDCPENPVLVFLKLDGTYPPESTP